MNHPLKETSYAVHVRFLTMGLGFVIALVSALNVMLFNKSKQRQKVALMH